MKQDDGRMQAVCDFIRAHSEESLSLEDMSRQAGLSPFHFLRRFKAFTGLTPKQFLDGCRLDALKGHLRGGGSVTDAIYEAGFGSSSRVYEKVDTRLGMTPKQYRAGGQQVSISYVSEKTPVGLMMMGATDRGLCFVQFGESEDELTEMLRKEYPKAQLAPMVDPYPEQFRAWMQALAAHLAGEQPSLQLPVDLRATAFQWKVWRYLQNIPYAEVQSYSEVAQGIGQPTAARAVARACATNRVAIVIPCHRVIRGTGELGGYRWGLDRKRALLDGERAARARGARRQLTTG
ncbi:methylated-DNA--[protein]-cysteine S-methyltransferase [uncultured Paludibaculum sp.]|uniref:bifunctional transcriptional activator/DNA repair enzyme AdaA n=1 Tax=uncultured Paludibaculum sp. TaxID=1765020 RepID=UPI002AAAA652|nr:methylated-DNA--[protein]-cysteine S-methyltransferase [uncultured Paludibaculum sp.]